MQDASSVTFVLEDEDHTLANSICYFLNKDPNVSFCGYSIPHPSERKVNLRIQTTGTITAAEALRQATLNLKQVCAHVGETFKAAVDKYESTTPPVGAADVAMADTT